MNLNSYLLVRDTQTCELFRPTLTTSKLAPGNLSPCPLTERVRTVPSTPQVSTATLVILLSWPDAVSQNTGDTASAIKITRTTENTTNSFRLALTFIPCSSFRMPRLQLTAFRPFSCDHLLASHRSVSPHIVWSLKVANLPSCASPSTDYSATHMPVRPTQRSRNRTRKSGMDMSSVENVGRASICSEEAADTSAPSLSVQA